MIWNEYLRQERDQAEHHRHGVAIDTRHKLGRLAHGGHIGRDIENIGQQEQQDGAAYHGSRKHGLHVGGQPLAGHSADPGAHGLHCGHHREGERHGPEHVQAELCAGLGIGGDATRVIVRYPGDQARAHMRERVILQALPKRLQYMSSTPRENYDYHVATASGQMGG